MWGNCWNLQITSPTWVGRFVLLKVTPINKHIIICLSFSELDLYNLKSIYRMDILFYITSLMVFIINGYLLSTDLILIKIINKDQFDPVTHFWLSDKYSSSGSSSFVVFI